MMAGVVVEILVKKGDAVEDGMEIAILESMKMQLPVQANAAGKVLEVKANSGDFVNEGDALFGARVVRSRIGSQFALRLAFRPQLASSSL